MSKSKILLNSGLILLSTFLTSVVFDQALRLFDYPDNNPTLYSHPPNFVEQRKNLDFKYTFKTNSQGLKSPEIPLEKPEGTKRILIVGDSFVEAYGVDQERSFSAVLEKNLRASDQVVEVINGGLSSTSPLQYARLFYHIGRKYKPDLLLICIYANDVSDTKVATTIDDIYQPRSGFSRYAHALWPRIYTQVELLRRAKIVRKRNIIAATSNRARRVNIPEAKIENWKKKIPKQLIEASNEKQFNGAILSTGLLNPSYWVDSIDIKSKKANEKWQVMQSMINEMFVIAKKNEISTALLYFPARFQYDPEQTNPDLWRLGGTTIRTEWMDGQSELQRRLFELARRADVAFLDMTPLLAKDVILQPLLNFKTDGHWSSFGHKLVAARIARWLEDNHKLFKK